MSYRKGRGVAKRLLMTFTALVVMASGLSVAQPASAKKGDDKRIEYTFNFVNGTTISGTATDNTVFLPGAGGSSVDNPTGMDVHVSCSDDFPGGWGEKDGPDRGADTAWQIASYSITKYKKDKVDKTCGDAFTPQPPAPIADPPAVDIEKYVNGDDADQPTGPQIAIGSAAEFTYRVTNTGGVALQNVVVTDSILGAVTCPKTSLAVDEVMWCSPLQLTVGNAGQFNSSAEVTAVARLTPGNPPALDDKGYSYSFTFVNGVTISGSSSKNVVFVPNAGGTSVENPTGMELHISCSDDFPGGWGEKDGPVRGVDTAWQIASYTINKYKKDKIDKTCGDTFVDVNTEVSDSDPVNFFAEDTPEPPQPPAECEVDLVGGTPELSWDPVDGAKRYIIWRNGQWLTRTKTTSYTDNAAPAGVKVRYELQVLFMDGSKGPRVDCGEVTPPQPPEPPVDVCDASIVGGTPTITWNEVDGAKRYAIWRNGEWIGHTKGLTFTDTDAPANKKASYQLRVIYKDGTKGPKVDCGEITPPKPPEPPTPPTLVCHIDMQNGKPVISWNDVDDAKRYAIWRNGEWIDQTKATQYRDGQAPGGVSLDYELRVVYNDGTKGERVPCGTITGGY